MRVKVTTEMGNLNNCLLWPHFFILLFKSHLAVLLGPCSVYDVLYACRAGCLCYIAQSLERDAGYVKGLVLRKAIFKEQPCLEKQFLPVFSKWYDI